VRKASLRIRRILAKNVRFHRARSGLSQEAFAELCGLHPKYIGPIEHARKNVTLATLEGLSAGTGVSPSELLAAASRG
jgi:transcriptional regulator with XRE-family HTH domain